MIKTTKQPIEEDVSIYEAEAKFLNQEPNEVLYYVNGKVITRTDGGDLLYGQLLEEDKEFFVFGSQLEAEGLLPVSDLDEKDREDLFKLNQLNSDINLKGIYAVAMEKVKEHGEEVVFATIAHPGHSENTYFYISVPDLYKLTPDQIDELPTYNEERTLNNPYRVQLVSDQMIAY